jgi:hypothetical protein
MAIIPARRDDRPAGTKELLIERDTMTEAAFLCIRTIDDPATPDDVREHARNVFSDLNFWLAFSDARSYPGERTIRMVPIGMHWPGFYAEMVEELLIDLGPKVVDDQPARVALARHTAKLVDEQGFSTDYRLDSLDALNEVLASLKAAADEAEELAEVET